MKQVSSLTNFECPLVCGRLVQLSSDIRYFNQSRKGYYRGRRYRCKTFRLVFRGVRFESGLAYWSP